MTDKPSDSAMSFEAVKISMSQDKNGVTLRLSVHPNDCPPSLHTDWVGTRYVVALVKLNDDDTIAKDKDAEGRKKAVAIAGTMCRNVRFQAWMVHMGIATDANEDEATKGMKEYLGIKSRTELERNEEARKKFNQLVASFELDIAGGKI